MRGQVVISAPARAALLGAVRAAQPNEACGALLGHCEYGEWWIVEEIESLSNEANAPDREYLISGAMVRKLEQSAEDNDTQVVGFFHSHPRGNTPSRRDLDQAWPGYVYIIADASADDDLSGWTLCEDRSAFAQVSISEP